MTTEERERLSVVVVGHVDHGKSTLVGRLMADTGNLPEGKLEAIRAQCERNSKPLEYAYLLDALKDEQAQGITIDSARCFFKTAKRDYIIIDAPGHIEFLKNMVSGAARADAALLLIDAHEGVRENSRRHGYFLSILGIDQFVVVINKMDLVGYRQEVFEQIEREYRQFLGQIKAKPVAFIPVDARSGFNVAAPSTEMKWYKGPTVLEMFDRFELGRLESDKPLRMPVQDVYKFTALGDERRIVAGRVEAGTIRAGDSILFSPSNKRAVVQGLEAFNKPAPKTATVGEPVGLTLTEQIYVGRGEMISREGEPPPKVTSRFRVDLFWLARQPMTPEKTYKFKLGAMDLPVQVEEVSWVLDASTLGVDHERKAVNRHEVAECILRTRRPAAFDVITESPRTGRFVIVDNYTIAGGGIIREALPDEESDLRREAFVRDEKWVRSRISPEMRAERFAQQAALIVITGKLGVGRKELARTLEQELFNMGRMVYFLGMGSVVHGLDADIRAETLGDDRVAREQVRRLGEMLHVLLDAGLIVICTAQLLTDKNLKDIETLVSPAKMVSIRIGAIEEGGADLRLDAPSAAAESVSRVIGYLKETRVLPDL